MMGHEEALVRVVTPSSQQVANATGFDYVSIIRFANGYSVTLSNDPAGWAGAFAPRQTVTTSQSLGRASRVANSLARDPK